MDRLTTLEALFAWWETATWVLGLIGALGTVGASVCGIRMWRINAEMRPLRAAESQRVEVEIARLTKDTAEANRKAEEERLARVKIEATLAPRTLSPQQRAAIVDQLRKHANQKVTILCPAVPELRGIGQEIEAALAGAGWAVGWIDGHNTARQFQGILVDHTPEANIDDLAASGALVHALKTQGLAVTGPGSTFGRIWVKSGASRGPEDANVWITIGPK